MPGYRGEHEHDCIVRLRLRDRSGQPHDDGEFRGLGRRLQLAEQAHSYSGSNPDCSHGDDLMGWGTGRGRAMVAPGLR